MARRLLVGMCAVVLVPGCGGGGGNSEQAGRSETTPTTSETRSEGPTRAEYVAKADAFCAEMATSRRGVAIAKSLREVRSTPRDDPAFRLKLAAHFRKVLRFARSSSDEFKAIEPPPADRAQIEEFHRANDEAIARLEEVVEAFERGRNPGRALAAYGSALGKADRLAEAYGFEVCARISERG